MLSLFVLLAFSAYGQTKAEKRLSRTDQAAIREAVYRHQLSYTAKSVKAVFLSFDGKALEEKLLSRLKAHNPSLKKLTEIEYRNCKVFEKRTNNRGVFYSVGEINRLNDDEVEITGSYYAGCTSAAGFIYIVKRQEEKWIVSNRTLRVAA